MAMNIMSGRIRALGLAFLAIGATALVARAQAPGGMERTGAKFHPDSSFEAERLLRNAQGHIEQGQWSESIDILQRVLDQFGDVVVPVPAENPPAPANPGAPAALPGEPETQRYVDVRRYCQMQLSALPAEALVLYQRRVDAQAERWYRQGVETGDDESLRQLVALAFCSSWGDDALELLGDRAFRDGRFAEALDLYRHLVPDPERPPALVHPDPDVNLARVAAKKLLCRAAMGEDVPGRSDLETYATSYPGAEGSLAGRDGLLLRNVVEALRSDGLVPSEPSDGRWPTFAGAPTRSKVAPGTVDIGSFQWKVKLDEVVPLRPTNPFNNRFSAPSLRPEQLLAYHPIVLGDQVVLCDANRLVAYNLSTRMEGEPDAPGAGTPDVPIAWEQSLPSSFGAPITRGINDVPSFTVTAYGDRIFARLGAPPERSSARATLSLCGITARLRGNCSGGVRRPTSSFPCGGPGLRPILWPSREVRLLTIVMCMSR